MTPDTMESSQLNKNLQYLFPTPFWMGIPDDDDLNVVMSELDSVIDDVISNDKTEFCSYVSFNAPPQREPGTKLENILSHYNLPAFTSFITSSILNYVGSSQWRLPYEYFMKTKKEPQVGINIHECWLNLSRTGAQQQVHCHPGSMISGVFYHTCKDGNSPIIFHNPNPIMKMGDFPEGVVNQMITFLPPQEGGLILFPSWLEHSTGKEQSDMNRYSVAFNCNVYLEVDESETSSIGDSNNFVWQPS